MAALEKAETRTGPRGSSQEGVDGGLGAGQRGGDVDGGGGQGAPGVGQDQGAAVPPGQGDGDVPLQRGQLLGDRRRRDVERLGHRGDAPAVAELAQDRELPCVHEGTLQRPLTKTSLFFIGTTPTVDACAPTGPGRATPPTSCSWASPWCGGAATWWPRTSRSSRPSSSSWRCGTRSPPSRWCWSCRRARTKITGGGRWASACCWGARRRRCSRWRRSGCPRTTATNAGLIISLTVIFTPLIDSVWQRRPMPAPFFAATVVGVVGVALLVSGGGFRAPGWGDGLMLAAAAVRAVHVSLIGRLTADRPYGSLTLTTIQAVVGAVVLSAVAAPAAGPGGDPACRSPPGPSSPTWRWPAPSSPSSPRPGRSGARPPAGRACSWAPNPSGPSPSGSGSAASA